MINKKEETVLCIALNSQKIAGEIVARAISVTPKTPEDAKQMLDIISNSLEEEKQIEEYLTVFLADKESAQEISNKLKIIVQCLELQVINLNTNNNILIKKQKELNPLTCKTKKNLITALADEKIANSIAKKIDIAIMAATLIPTAE